MTPTVLHPPYMVTGSKRGDLLLFLFLLLILITLSGRLRVYFGYTLVRLHVVAVAPDGHRTECAPPALMPGRDPPTKPLAVPLPALEKRIRNFMTRHGVFSLGGPGDRIEWILDYSRNSSRLDQRKVLVFAPHEQAVD